KCGLLDELGERRVCLDAANRCAERAALPVERVAAEAREADVDVGAGDELAVLGQLETAPKSKRKPVVVGAARDMAQPLDAEDDLWSAAVFAAAQDRLRVLIRLQVDLWMRMDVLQRGVQRLEELVQP